MAEGLARRQSSRFLIALFLLIGAAIGFLLYFLLSSPVDPVMTVVNEYTRPGPHPDAALTVTFFERFSYTRTAPSATAFDAEVMIWNLVPLALAVLVGALVGGVVGYMTGWWLPRARF